MNTLPNQKRLEEMYVDGNDNDGYEVVGMDSGFVYYTPASRERALAIVEQRDQMRTAQYKIICNDK